MIRLATETIHSSKRALLGLRASRAARAARAAWTALGAGAVFAALWAGAASAAPPEARPERLQDAPPEVSGAETGAHRAVQSGAVMLTPKPMAPVSISHRLNGEPVLGQPLELVVIVTAKADLANGVLHLSGGEGLAVTSPAADVWLPNLTREATHEIPVTVLPFLAERLYLHIAVKAEIGGRFRGRSIAIPIPVGPAKPSGAESLKIDGDGQRLHALPAQESVR